MPFGVSKRLMTDSKTSPLKVVSPIIRKYDEHRQKRIKFTRETANNMECLDGLTEDVATDNMLDDPIGDEVLQPVQEICAIARLATEELRQSNEKIIKPRKRVPATSVSAKKKLLRHSKMMESALEVLRPEARDVSNAKEDAYVLNYFNSVRSAVTASQFSKFCELLEEFESPGASVSKIFRELSSLLSSQPDLLDDFIPFLTPHQALECNIFMEHFMLTKMADFLVLLDSHFSKTPFQTKKIVNALEKLSQQPGVTISEVSSAIMPMLKGHPVLTDFFLELFPNCRPPDAFLTEFDELDEEALSEEDDVGETWERVDIPVVCDPYSGDACICSCHDTDDMKRKTRAVHCTACSIKYINGKVFIQSGKLLRRAQVNFQNGDMEFHRHRLFPSAMEPQKRKRSNSHALSPTKVAHVSSDELKSDDDDKKKTKMSRAKSVSKRVRSFPADNDANKLECDANKDVQTGNNDADNSGLSEQTEPCERIAELVNLIAPKEETDKAKVDADEDAAVDERPWKMDEDRVILQTLQVERYCEETFTKISDALPTRTVSDIKSRFQALLNILYKMKAEANE